ncbi:MAG: ABC transporter ATP-binding protein [Bdellovibrionales bacterium]
MEDKKVIIELKNFRKSFGEKLVHEDINFKVFEGECVGLLGGSGIGKSVLLRSLIGLEKPDSGEVNIFEKNIAPYSEQQLVEIRKRVAYVFQGGALFDSMSVWENLAYPLVEHTNLNEAEVNERILETLAELHMPDTESLYPADLSGGMQKRIGLARSIIMGPEVILYDEPTAGLDPFNTKRIQDIILDLKTKKVTSILVTHDVPTAIRVCDRVIMVGDGVVKTEVSKKDLTTREDEFYTKFIEGEVK